MKIVEGKLAPVSPKGPKFVTKIDFCVHTVDEYLSRDM